MVNTKDEVLPAIPKLVAPIRKALGDSTPASVQLESAGGAFTAASLETVHQYSLGMQQQFAGNSEEALRSFSRGRGTRPGVRPSVRRHGRRGHQVGAARTRPTATSSWPWNTWTA